MTPPDRTTLEAVARKWTLRETEERARELATEKTVRAKDALELYRPYNVIQEEFHRSMASELLLRGGNRSGKSTASLVEVASAAMRVQLHAADGSLLPMKYPTNRPLTIWTIAYGEKNINTPIHRLLFEPGAFKIIKDLKTGEMRAWNPKSQSDVAREAECQQSPPLIPERAISDWAWKSWAARVFMVCRLKNGTEIHAFTSNAKPKQGDPVDLILIDEDIWYEQHVAEWQARLSDRKGRLIWSAFPHGQNNALKDMHHRAEAQKHLKNPDVWEGVLTFSKNPYMDTDEVRKRREGWSEDEARARDLGEFTDDVVQMFPMFNKSIHCVEVSDRPMHRIDDILVRNGLEPPNDWTRYLILDPGHTRPAVLFAAVPPPELGDYIICYDEIYGRNIDAFTLAERVLDKASGHNFEKFIIDARAGRQTPMGFSWTIKEQYARAFEQHQIESNLTDSSFEDGSDNLPARTEMIRTALHARNEGPPRLRVVAERCPNMLREFVNYKKRMRAEAILDEPIPKDDHLMSCLGYLVASNPQYVPPQPAKAAPSAALLEFQRWQKADKRHDDKSMHFGPAA